MTGTSNKEKIMNDKLEIRENIEKWVVYRDSYDWVHFRDVWHKDGVMKATWFEGPYEEFIARNEAGLKKGLNILHILGGSVVDVKDDRAVSITKMIILQRALIDGVMCDVSCYARHFDCWEYSDEKWGLVRRETIADKDRMDPVDNSAILVLDAELLNKFPVEYQHLAYLQVRSGFTVDPDAPRISGGESLDALYKRGEIWLNKQ